MSPEPTGRRRADGWPPSDAKPGDYWRTRGVWYCMTPSGDMGNLREHEVTEHQNGTITVSPSILVKGGKDMTEELWHGFLERGVWRQ